MKFRIIPILMGALVSVGAFALPKETISAMVELDRAYIPALALSGQPDQMDKAKTAFIKFEKTWTIFKERYLNQSGFDTEWTQDINRIDMAVTQAKSALLDRSEGAKAHEELEAVRMIFLESRTRQKIPYFIDTLTLFHNSMEDMLNGISSAKIASWTEAERINFTADLDITTARWNKVKAANALLSDLNLEPKVVSTFEVQWKSIDKLLKEIKDFYKSGDQENFNQSLNQLKPAFIKTFFLFGNFPK
jgi:hypothetical protein